VLLDVLTVIALTVGQAEQALLEDGVLAIPEGQGETEPLLVVGNAGQSVLAPAVGAGARLVMGEIVPGVAALAVVLADGPPLSLAEVWSPPLPGDVLGADLVQTGVLGGHRGNPRYELAPSSLRTGAEKWQERIKIRKTALHASRSRHQPNQQFAPG